MPARVSRAWLAMAVCAALACSCCGTAAAADGVGFLGDSLPLKVVVTTPVEILSAPAGQKVRLVGSQALQAVFSRPIIALGSDFGAEDNYGGKVPFNLTCNAPGRFRWVTTTIARFDPTQDWPTDLDCTLVWNTNLTTHDGVALQLGDVPTQRGLETLPLTMAITDVTSATADNLTGGLWAPDVGAPWDKVPWEVPPDGIISLSFSYPVNLSMLQTKLRIGSGSDVVNVSRCQSPVVWPFAAGDGVEGVTPAPLSLDYEDTCARVKIRQELKTNSEYKLAMNSGAMYNSLSGPLRKQVSVVFYGLRRFTVPLKQDFQETHDSNGNVYSGVTFRRLDLWLPHGLHPDMPISDLAQQITICLVANPSNSQSSCKELEFELVLTTPGEARMTVPALQPDSFYRVTVSASAGVLDGFGLPLEASKQAFWTTAPASYFTGPSFNSNVALFELPASSATIIPWPVLASSIDARSDSDTQSVASWAFRLTDDASARTLASLVFGDYNTYVPDVLGKPTSEVTRSVGSTGPEQLSLQLDASKASIHVIHTCCNVQTWTRPPSKLSSDIKVVTISNLSAAFVTGPHKVTAWVTRTNGVADPVEGATVWLFTIQDNTDTPTAVMVGKCTTDANGVCSLPLNATYVPGKGSSDGYSVRPMVKGGIVGLVSSGTEATVVPNAGYFYPSSRSSFRGTLVADRLLVRPAETLHLTGYLQQQADDGTLVLPKSPMSVTVQLSQGWDPAHPNEAVVIPAELTASSGSFQLKVPVPAGISMGVYSVSVSVPTDSKSDTPGDASIATPKRRLLEVGVQKQEQQQQQRSLSPGRRHLHGAVTMDPVVLGFAAPDIGASTSSKRASTTSMPYDPQPSGSQEVIASMTITVADPRPPTAELILTLPAWVKPGADITVQAQATSYLGTSVAGAAMTLTWRTSLAQGLLTLTTNASGAANATVALSDLPAANATFVGETLSVELKWVGPTREVIMQTGSVRIEASSHRMSVAQHPPTDTPGVAFGISSIVTSNEDGSDANGVPVKITLAPSGNGTAKCDTTSSCTIFSGIVDLDACQLSLPCVGNFTLTACTMAGDIEQACDTLILGRNDSSWTERPLDTHPPLSMSLANAVSSPFSVGDTAMLSFQIPKAASSLLLVWGNTLGAKSKAVTGLNAGPVTVPIVLGSECRGGCSVVATLAAPRGGSAPGVPMSLLFDPLRPLSASDQLQLDVVEDNSLDVTVTVAASNSTAAGQPVVAPGGSATVLLKVAYQGSAVSDAEVTVIGVDKAVLDLLPYPLADLSAEMAIDLAATMSSVTVEDMRLHPEAIAAAFAAALRRSLADPWISPETQCQPYMWSTAAAPADVSDADYLSRFTTAITYMTASMWGYNPGILYDGISYSAMSKGDEALAAVSAVLVGDAPAAGNSAMADAGSAAAPAPQSGADGRVLKMRLQSDFVATPLFMVARTSAIGAGAVTFTAPANLGTFVMRAYVVEGSTARYGAAETEVVVRRLLSLTPSLPRFVRIGDTFEAGVIVTGTGVEAGDPALTVGVGYELAAASPAPINGTGSSSKVVAISGEQKQQEVLFSFQATALGTANVTFSVTDGMGTVDSVQLELEVLGRQSPITVATSFPLRVSNASDAPWQEGLDLPSAVPGSGSLNLLAGVGYLPGVITLYLTLAAAYRPDYPDGYTAFALTTTTPALSAYRVNLSDAEAASAAAGVADVLGPLAHMRYGLLPYVPSLWRDPPQRADIVLNAWAFWLTDFWPQPTPSDSGWSNMVAAAPAWRTAAQVQLLADALAARTARYNPGPYSDFYTLAWARLSFGSAWSPSVCTSYQERSAGTCAESANIFNDLSMERLVREAPGQGLDVQVLVSLALQAQRSKDPLLAETIKQIVLSIRVTARTAYIAASPGAKGPAQLGTQSLALLLLLGAPPSQVGSPVLLQKLAAYVAQGGASGASGHLALVMRTSPMYAALATRTLTMYDELAGSTTPDLQLVAAVDNVTVLEASFGTANMSPQSSSTPWEDLPSPPGSLDFRASGRGEASIAAMLTFEPAKLLPFPTYRGLWVESSLQLVDPLTNSPHGPSLSSVPLGSIVSLTIQVTSPDALSSVVVEVLMPAGLEPLDPNVSPAAGSPCALRGVGGFWWWWWWPPCPSQETRPSVVTFTYDYLMAGTSSVQVLAVAATPGDFARPPVSAYAENQPEVTGMTAAGRLRVCVGCAPVAVELPPPPRACPDNCNGNGACNLDDGTCVCGSDFTGDNCSEIVPN
ncbi:hypothetical protein FOA52_004931 [Chlamydomonas sp. UWO 241]|nr:hypothetical protein FOA52_004931 [Chlamydomonas sp. UWO 241]